MSLETAAAPRDNVQEDIAFQARLYDDPNPTRRNLHRARKAWIEGRLETYLQPGMRVLEVGVGCGVFTRFLSEKRTEVTAVDINQAFLDGVENLAGVSPMYGDATTDLGLRGFDVGVSSEVIEHVPPASSATMLKEFYRSLRPGGVLVLSTPQRFSTLELTARLLQFSPVLALAKKIYGSADDLGHINLMTRTELQRQIREAGFVIVYHDIFGFYLPGIAEFGGSVGMRFLVSVGKILKRVPVLRGLLWTQGYVLRKPMS